MTAVEWTDDEIDAYLADHGCRLRSPGSLTLAFRLGWFASHVPPAKPTDVSHPSSWPGPDV